MKYKSFLFVTETREERLDEAQMVGEKMYTNGRRYVCCARIKFQWRHFPTEFDYHGKP